MQPGKDEARKRGNRAGFWFFRVLVMATGLRGAYGFLYLVCLYYLLADRKAVAASMAYVRRRFPDHGKLRRYGDVYLLFVNQGKCLIDRYYVASGGSGITIDIKGYDGVRQLLQESGKGFILLTAHVGSWQTAMTALRGFGRTVHLMMRREDNAAVRETLQVDSGNEQVKVLFTDDSLGGVIEAMKAVAQGDLVSIMGDRAYDFSSLEADLLGGRVRFPYGAFSLAAAARCPVVVLLSAKTGVRSYLCDVSRIIEPPVAVRPEREAALKRAVQEFASILETYAQEHPYQWFVFRDIWTSNG